jgi:hypothetical protein
MEGQQRKPATGSGMQEQEGRADKTELKPGKQTEKRSPVKNQQVDQRTAQEKLRWKMLQDQVCEQLQVAPLAARKLMGLESAMDELGCPELQRILLAYWKQTAADAERGKQGAEQEVAVGRELLNASNRSHKGAGSRGAAIPVP